MAGKQIKLDVTDQVEIHAALTTALRRDRENLTNVLKAEAADAIAFYTRTTLRLERLLDLIMDSQDVMLTMPEGWDE